MGQYKKSYLETPTKKITVEDKTEGVVEGPVERAATAVKKTAHKAINKVKTWAKKR